jgi:hypothetical protein
MAKFDEPARGRLSLVCPECREFSRLKGRLRRFRCSNGHSYPIEALLALKERRLETLGWSLPALERLTRDLFNVTPRGPASDKSRDISPPVVAEHGRVRRGLSAQRRFTRRRTSEVTELAVPALKVTSQR